MRKELTFIVFVCLVLGFTFKAPLNGAEEVSEETHDISLYLFGKGGHSPHVQSDPSGNLTTTAPNKITDDIQTFYPEWEQDPRNTRFWYSDPLNVNISINGDVHFSIWAMCSDPRYLGLWIGLEISKPGVGGHGQFVWTGGKLVYNEPVEFNALILEEDINDELKKFSTGSRIGIGIDVEFTQPQPSAEVSVLYNSTNHPSHMTINTSSIYIDIMNSSTPHKKASFDVKITDAFGVNDVAIHDVQVIGPSGEKIVDLEVIEDTNMEEGTIILHVSLDKSKDGDGNYTITITVKDINYNSWRKEEVLELNFPENENEPSLTLYFLVLIAIGVIIVIIIYVFLSRKRK